MKNKITKIIKKIEDNSFLDIENKELFIKYITESIENNKKITFFNWECPPRFIDFDKNGKEFVNYELDLNNVFKGIAYDKYTEFPRCVCEKDREKQIFEFLNFLDFKYRFIKIIADTNALYLNKESIDILGKDKVMSKFEDFKNRVYNEIKSYNIKNNDFNVYLFTEIFPDMAKKYDNIFNEYYKKLQNNIPTKLEDKFIKQQIQRTKDHMGISDEKIIKDFTFRTIASYGAEGIIFDKLSKTNRFSNMVWLNIEEANERTKAITNFIRKEKGISNLPMIFLK